METPSLSIVIPAFNEARRIGSSVTRLQQWLSASAHQWEIRVVDDGSLDNTAEIVESLAHRDERIVSQREHHRGKGSAVRAGMLAAPSELRFMCDADLSMPTHELPRFLAEVPARCDIAIASRQHRGARRVGEPAYRHLMGRGFNTFVQTVLPGIDDSQCGFKMFTARAAHAIFSKATIDGFAFDVEALVIARLQGWRIIELPIEWHHHAESRVSPVRDAYRMARDVWRIRSNDRRGLYR